MSDMLTVENISRMPPFYFTFLVLKRNKSENNSRDKVSCRTEVYDTILPVSTYRKLLYVGRKFFGWQSSIFSRVFRTCNLNYKFEHIKVNEVLKLKFLWQIFLQEA